MEVYICTVGERGEGSSIRKVYRNKAHALKWLEEQHAASEGANPIRQVASDYISFNVSCDIYAVKTWVVE